MTCKICGKPTKKPTATYCSKECHNESKRGKRESLDSTKRVRCKIDGKEYEDYLNRSGCLTVYSKTTLGKAFDWNDWEVFDVDAPTLWQCPHCDWNTRDHTNKSGCITIHLDTVHGLKPEDHCKDYPADEGLWIEYWKHYRKEVFKEESVDNRVQCKICGGQFMSITQTHLATHGYTVEQYKNEFGDNVVSKKTSDRLSESYYHFRPELNPQDKSLAKTSSRNSTEQRCKICNKPCTSLGIVSHLKRVHDVDIDDYVKMYGEFRVNKLKKQDTLGQVGDKFRCKICNVDHESDRSLTHHVITDHNLTKEQYVLEHLFNGVNPLCKCGCGNPVGLLTYHPYCRDYVSGHNEPTFGRRHTTEAREKMRQAALERGVSTTDKKDTKVELLFESKLKEWGIAYQKQYRHELGVVDFFANGMCIEIDGEYWHPITVEYLSEKTLSSVISQIIKSGIPNLIRIRSNDVRNLEKFDDVFKYNHVYDMSVGYEQVIIDKNYLLTRSMESRQMIAHLVLKLIRTAGISFPYPPVFGELDEICQSIRNGIRQPSGKVFSNNGSTAGVKYLKSIFRSFWNSSFKGKKTPVEVWEDDVVMRKIIEYRCGVNDGNEMFDITLKQIVTGISVNRYTVSFFKPSLAASIYRHFIGDVDIPVVFDPCAGFGGRLLGFKAAYPNGRYIACEPNKQTYDELCVLAEDFDGVELYNCKLEDFEVNKIKDIDLAFTSIPYYDLETYTSPMQYESIDDWDFKFLSKIRQIPNLVLNVPVGLRDRFDPCDEYLIESNTSNFDPSNNKKREYLLTFFK